MNYKSFFIGLFAGIVITLVITGYFIWAAVGAIPLVGGAIQYKIKKKLKVAPPRHKRLRY